MKFKNLFIAGTAVLALVSPPMHAFNTQFLDNTPISRLNDEDIEIMLQTLTLALDNADNGAEVEWSNPKTGNHGTITPLDNNTVDSRDCRLTVIKTFAGELTGSARYQLCKADDGEWRVTTN
jgi:surface antigen